MGALFAISGQVPDPGRPSRIHVRANVENARNSLTICIRIGDGICVRCESGEYAKS